MTTPLTPAKFLSTASKPRIDSFVNNDGQQVHAVFVPATVDGGRVISQHCGTFATEAEAKQRIEDHAAGRLPKWSEPE
jgi:hypothetical protein